MKYIILTLFFPLFLSAQYLVVSSNPTGGVADGEISVNNITKSFDSSFVIGSNSQTKEFPIYMNSDSTDTVRLKISNFTPLSNSKDGDSIAVTIHYKSTNGNYSQLHDGDIVTLSGDRDGNSIVGYIKVMTEKIANTQTFGNYQLSNSISVALEDTWSSNANLNINANVSLVAIAKLSTSSSQTIGEKFVSSSINFNSFSETSIEQDFYIKSNSNKAFKITFNNTPDLLLNGTDNTNKIAMQYYYENTEIEAGKFFSAYMGKNSGQQPIGNIKFKVNDNIASKIAGEYSASISVTVSAQ